jgi:SagB-type dehydrogenase family enzyme
MPNEGYPSPTQPVATDDVQLTPPLPSNQSIDQQTNSTSAFAAAQPTSAPQPAQPATAPPPHQHSGHGDCSGDKECGACMKGGMPMKKEKLSFLVILLVGMTTVFFALWVVTMRERDAARLTTSPAPAPVAAETVYSLPEPKAVVETIALPQPRLTSSVSVEQSLATRRSRREYSPEPVSLQALSQVLWSAQGVTNDLGNRTAPSSRGAYPYTVYVVVRNVTGLEPGLYQYSPDKYELLNLGEAGVSEALVEAGVQDNSKQAPVVLALAASYAVMAEKSPADPVTGTLIEAGHIGQNIYLQIEALRMGTVVTAGFDKVKVGQALTLDPNEEVIYLVPFGLRAEE